MNKGAIIQDIREEKGLSRDEVVRRNPYWSYQAWGRLERGERQLAVDEIEEVAIALSISNKELLEKLGLLD
ncbi:MAG: helix-turn-helix transcriptional regulator [Symploca sp. SIO2D2]|nr:helix-turn-helix transcriptional regulator [Symploca sp. SIO2D2]